MMDVQDLILQPIAADKVSAEVYAERSGVLSGIDAAVAVATELGLTVLSTKKEGDLIELREPILRLQGTPKQMVMAEDRVIGLLAKTSGIATAARTFRDAAGDAFRIVCGSWKKVDAVMKEPFRQAVLTGGCGIRLLDEPMVYLDKNYILMFGNIQEALEHISETDELKNRKKVVQVKGYDGDLSQEFWDAAEFGADVIYLDTGNLEDFQALEEAKPYMEHIPPLAFGGNVRLEDLERIKKYPVDIVGVGKAIIDAPMIDMRLNVVTKRPHICDCPSGHLKKEG